MGIIMHNDIPYGGGSSIEPNPQESATDQLETLGIDGDVYEVTDANAAREVQETITEAQSRANLADGDSVPTIFGKIKKWFSDLKDLAFIGKDGTSSTKYLRGDGTWQNFPTIPTVNNGTLTIQKNGTNVATFSANQSANATANIECATPSDVEGSKVVTGNPITITDAAGIKAEKIEIGFEPKQAGSGTPSPSNIRPITGYTSISADGCGKNLWGGNKMKSDILSKISTATSPSDNEVSFYPNGTVQNVRVLEDLNGESFKENTQYTFIVKSKNTNIVWYQSQQIATTNLRFFYTDGTFDIIYHVGSSANTYYTTAVKSNASKTVSYIGVVYQSGDATFDVTNCGIFEGNVATSAFEAYNGLNVTVQFDQTLYGGKLTILQDGSADVYCDRGLINCGSLTYSYDTSATHPFFVANVSSEIKLGASGISSAYINAAVTLANDTNGAFAFLPNSHNVRIRDNAHTDPTEFKTYLTNNNITIVAELATPFTLHLSPVETLTLLQGINNVWTDGTTLSLTYQPDNAIGQAKGTAQDAMAMVNALASTAVKVIAKNGEYDAGVWGFNDMPNCSLSLDKGTYLIMAWCYFTAYNIDTNKEYGCAICDSSNTILSYDGHRNRTEDPEGYYGATSSTFILETITTDATVRKLRGYMCKSVTGNPIRGGIAAFKLS